MSLSRVAGARFPRLTRSVQGWADGWNRLGEQAAFFAKTIGSVGDAITRYNAEALRVIADMSLGVGALALLGGSVVIICLFLMALGAIVGIFGYGTVNSIGLGALAGFFSAYANVRLSIPIFVANALAATIGAGATAQIGAMRISEEIDALEVMGVRTVAYLASTRVLGGLLVAPPLYCIAFIACMVTTRITVVLGYGQGAGGYDHYFNTFLQTKDVILSGLECTAQAAVVMLICTYYGYNASGGPAGVGEAVGRAVRASIATSLGATLALAMVLYGKSGDFHLSG